MVDQDPAADAPDYLSIGEQIGAGLLKIITVHGLQKMLVSAGIEQKTGEIATLGELATTIAVYVGKGIAALEEPVAPILAGFAAPIVAGLFDTTVDPSAFLRRDARGQREPAAAAIVDAVMKAIAGDASAQTEPSDAGAKRIASASVHAAIEGWFNGVLPEIISDFMPFEWLHFEDLAGLGEDVIRALGLGRLVRRALAPLVDATAATPMKWHVNRIYRPELLTPADAIRQMLRGRWTDEQTREELARQGWSESRIEALINAQQKSFSVADVRTFVDREHWTRDQGLQHLRDQGYDEAGAQDALRLEGLKLIASIESQEGAAILSAYVARDIERFEFLDALRAHVSPAPERALLEELGEVRRALNVKHLSSSDAAACVKAGILAVMDYREALRREGYDEGAVLAKELLLRWELDKQTTIAQHRKAADAERAAEKAARDQAAAAKRAQLAADRALARRGKASDLERAVVRGLVPIARYEEVIAASYDTDTVDVLTGLVEQERQTYLAQQQKAADAAKRAALKGISIGELQAAVLEHVLTVDEYRGRLVAQHFPADDVNVLTATLAGKLADQEAAKALRADAAAKAKIKAIDLARFEQLVRKGHRTVQEYDALLVSLDYDDASRAALDELLHQKIADDTAAADAREARDAKKTPGAVTIAQFRRAVLLGLKSEAEFDSFLTSQRIPAEEHALLAAELHNDVDQAAAAQHRRDQAQTRSDARDLSLSTVAQAARLGIIPVTLYRQRLERAGYGADDVAIELDLLVQEIADVQAARATRSRVEPAARAKGLSLADVAKAVKAGAATLEQYRSRAVELGLDAGDVDTLTRVLGDELAETKAARVRRADISSDLDARQVSLAVLEQEVRDGALTIGAYGEQLAQLGIAPDDAALLVALLGDTLAGERITP